MHEIGNNYGHLAKIALWNLKNCQNFKINDKFKGVADINFFPGVIFIVKTENNLKTNKILQYNP